MSRPKNKKKGRTLPMSSNGNHEPGVPPDIEWDENDPPVLFSCSQHTVHAKGCDGSCDVLEVDENIVNLLNEARAFARAGMSFHGVPTCLPHGVFDGIPINVFDEKIRNMVLQKILVEAGLATEDDVEAMYRILKYETLHEIRMEHEASVKKLKMEQRLGVSPGKILGPDGQPLDG